MRTLGARFRSAHLRLRAEATIERAIQFVSEPSGTSSSGHEAAGSAQICILLVTSAVAAIHHVLDDEESVAATFERLAYEMGDPLLEAQAAKALSQAAAGAKAAPREVAVVDASASEMEPTAPVAKKTSTAEEHV